MHIKFKHLLEITMKLRGEGGCPWDRDQTIEKMRPNVLEEAQEVAEAIDNNDSENLKEEIGDLLLCLVMMTQIASEGKDSARRFDMGDVLDTVAEKVISRHTWVFGTDTAKTPEEALALWKKNKVAEADRKRSKNQTGL